jgi:predicted nucleotidyltransferase
MKYANGRRPTAADACGRLGVSSEEVEAVCRRFGVRMLVLFGSRAPGGLKPGPDSDLDLAVSFQLPRRQVDPWVVREAFAEAFLRQTIDLVDVRNVDPLFRWEIMEQGVLLYGDIDEFLEYRAYAYRDYIDSADLRALERVLSDRKLTLIREQLRAAP